MPKISIPSRWTSRPFLLTVADFFKNIGAVVLVLSPNVSEAKVNAIIALAVASTAVVAAFTSSELNKDGKVEAANIEATKPVAPNTVVGEVNTGNTQPTTPQPVQPQQAQPVYSEPVVLGSQEDDDLQDIPSA